MATEPRQTLYSTGSNSEIETVTIDVSFYHRLIDIAADSFINARLEPIKANLVLEIEGAKDMDKLVQVCKNFIQEREFVDRVIAEKEKIEQRKRK